MRLTNRDKAWVVLTFDIVFALVYDFTRQPTKLHTIASWVVCGVSFILVVYYTFEKEDNGRS